MAPSLQNARQGVAATEEPINAQLEGVDSPETMDQANINASSSSGDDFDTFDDSGFYEAGSNYKDGLLFPDNLPVIDPELDKFFEDANASTRAESGSFYSDVSESAAQIIDRIPFESPSQAQGDDALFSHTVYEVVQVSINDAVYEVIKDYDVRSHPEYIPPATAVIATDPLRWWVRTRHRHEQIAYQFEQPPFAVRDSERQ